MAQRFVSNSEGEEQCGTVMAAAPMFDKLEENTYSYWKHVMRGGLYLCECEDAIRTEIVFDLDPEADEKVQAVHAAAVKRDKQALEILLMNVGAQFTPLVANCRSAHEAWVALENHFNGPLIARQFDLRRQLAVLSIKKDESVASFSLRLTAICNSLIEAQVPITPTEKKMTFLYGVAAAYPAALYMLHRAMDDNTTITALVNHLHLMETIVRNAQVLGGSGSSGSGNSRKGRRARRC